MEFIFIDSNVFYNNWYLKSADFKYLFNYIENTNSMLLISELVCEEVDNLRSREIDSIVRTILKEIEKLKKLNPETASFNYPEKESEKYNFKRFISEKTDLIDFISYDQIRQCDIVKRAIRRIKPFQEEEKGFRDTLIWLSFVGFLKDRNIYDDIYFITNNKTDFYNKKGDDFHPDLKKDILEYDLKCKITPFNSLYAFIESKVDKSVHGIKEKLLYDEHLNNIDSQLEAETIDFINGVSTNQFKTYLENNRGTLQFPYIDTLISHSIEIMEGVEDPEILAYKEISNGSFYVNFRYNLRICVLELTISNSEYYSNRVQIDNLYNELFTDESFTSYCAYPRIYLDVSFEYSLKDESLSGFNIQSIYFE